MERQEPIRVGEEAPDFSLPATDNSVWSLKHLLRGERVLILFYRRDCPASRMLLPFLERMHRRLNRSGLRVAGVAQDPHRDSLEAADAFQLTFPLLIDHPRLAVTRAFGVREVPTQVWLSRQATVLGVASGFSRREQDQLFLLLARDLGQPEASLFHEGDMVPDRMPPTPLAPPR